MTRRAWLLAVPCCRALLAADAAEQAYQLVAAAASRLADNNVGGFLDCFDPSMPGYDSFAESVRGLMEQCEVTSSIDLRANQGDETARALELDWTLQLKLRFETQPIERRRERVKCRAQRAGKKWKFVAFTPQSLLAPMKLRGGGE
jgi:hypothetical protein